VVGTQVRQISDSPRSNRSPVRICFNIDTVIVSCADRRRANWRSHDDRIINYLAAISDDLSWDTVRPYYGVATAVSIWWSVIPCSCGTFITCRPLRRGIIVCSSFCDALNVASDLCRQVVKASTKVRRTFWNETVTEHWNSFTLVSASLVYCFYLRTNMLSNDAETRLKLFQSVSVCISFISECAAGFSEPHRRVVHAW